MKRCLTILFLNYNSHILSQYNFYLISRGFYQLRTSTRLWLPPDGQSFRRRQYSSCREYNLYLNKGCILIKFTYNSYTVSTYDSIRRYHVRSFKKSASQAIVEIQSSKRSVFIIHVQSPWSCLLTARKIWRFNNNIDIFCKHAFVYSWGENFVLQYVRNYVRGKGVHVQMNFVLDCCAGQSGRTTVTP